jgi:lipid II:glycine glycyltransferase (peptidoglycan interpeptide bridge formation enzyme)
VPWGPELPEGFPGEARNAALLELALAVRAFLPKDTAFIRFDPPWYSEDTKVSDTLVSGAPGVTPPGPPFIRAGADVQPPDTVLIDLADPGEDLLAGMKPKWRYNARLALKRGVTLRRAGEEGVEQFYALLKETAGRDGIAIHGIEYYRTLFSHDSAPAPDIRLYLAEHEGDVLAGIVTLFRGKEAVYLYGASSDKKRNLMAPYALQLKAMEDARAAGCEIYDLFGIPPTEDPDHPMAGLYRFKTGFGGRIIHRSGSWDMPYRPLAYRLFRTAETLRKTLRKFRKNHRQH